MERKAGRAAIRKLAVFRERRQGRWKKVDMGSAFIGLVFIG